jgi:hypothetical protein
MFEQTSTSKLNADIKENMKARAKGVIKEGDTIIDGTKCNIKDYAKICRVSSASHRIIKIHNDFIAFLYGI